MQFAAVEQRIRGVDAPAQLRETARLRLEKMYRAFRAGLAESRHQCVVTRRARLFRELHAEHQLVARRDGGLPFEIGAALGKAGERPRIATADPQFVDILRSDAQ